MIVCVLICGTHIPQISVLVPRYGLETTIDIREKLERSFAPANYSVAYDAEKHVLTVRNKDPTYGTQRLQVFDRVEVLIHVEDRANGSRALVLDLCQPCMYPEPNLDEIAQTEQELIDADETPAIETEAEPQAKTKRPRKSHGADSSTQTATGKRRKK